MKLIKKTVSAFLIISIIISTVCLSAFNSSAVISLSGIDGYLTNQLYARGMTALSTVIDLISDSTDDPEVQSQLSFIKKWVFGNSESTSVDDVKNICEDILSTVTDIKETTENIESLENAAVITDTAKAYEDAWINQVDSVINAGNDSESLQNVFDAYVDYLSYACGSKELKNERSLEYYEKLYKESLIDLCAANAKTNYIDPTADRDAYYTDIMFTTDVIDTIIKNRLMSLVNYLEYDAKGNRYIDKAALLAYYAMPYSTQQADFIDAAAERQLNTITLVMMIYQDFLSSRANYYTELKEKCVEGYKTTEECNRKFAVYQKMYQNVFEFFGDEVLTFMSSPICLNNGYVYATAEFSAYMREDSVLNEDGGVKLVNTTFKKSVGVNKYQTSATYTNNLLYNKNACVKIKDNKLCFYPFYVLNGEKLSKENTLLKSFNYIEEEDFELSDWIINDIYWPTCDYYNLKDGVYSDGVNTYRTIADTDSLKNIINETCYSAYKHTPYTYFSDYLKYGSKNSIYLVLRKGVKYININDYTDRYHKLPLFNMKNSNGYSTSWNVEYVNQPDFGSQMYAQILINNGNELYSKVDISSENASVTISGVTNGKAVSGTSSEVSISAPEGYAITKVTVEYHNDASDPEKITGERVLNTGVTVNELTINMDIPYSNITLKVETKEALPTDEEGNFLVANYRDLMQMFEMINSGERLFVNGNYKLICDINCIRVNELTDDIDINNGNEDSYFNGNFDGSGFCISGLGFGMYYFDEDERRPLFDVLGENAVIENLRIDGAIIKSEVEDADAMGVICSENKGIIQSCIISNSLIAADDADYTGGFAGVNNGVIQNCGIAKTGFEAKDAEFTGGISAVNNGNVKNCFSYMCDFRDGTAASTSPLIFEGNQPINSYFCTASAVNKSFGTEKKYEQFLNGETAYLLNNGVTDGTQPFYQNLSVAEYPEILSSASNKTVYKNADGNYTNTL